MAMQKEQIGGALRVFFGLDCSTVVWLDPLSGWRGSLPYAPTFSFF
jgi:hypothetical protein